MTWPFSTLAELRLPTVKQVQRLHVTDGSPIAQTPTNRALLQCLTDLHLVVRLPRRVGGIRAGSEGHHYGLSGLGQAVLGVGGPSVGGAGRCGRPNRGFRITCWPWRNCLSS